MYSLEDKSNSISTMNYRFCPSVKSIGDRFLLVEQHVQTKPYSFTLYDKTGRKIICSEFIQNEMKLAVPVSGLYLYRFESSKAEVQTGKVLVK